MIKAHKKLCIKKLVNPAINRELKKRIRERTLILYFIFSILVRGKR